jgi:uncharacterized membrane protein YfcA
VTLCPRLYSTLLALADERHNNLTYSSTTETRMAESSTSTSTTRQRCCCCTYNTTFLSSLSSSFIAVVIVTVLAIVAATTSNNNAVVVEAFSSPSSSSSAYKKLPTTAPKSSSLRWHVDVHQQRSHRRWHAIPEHTSSFGSSSSSSRIYNNNNNNTDTDTTSSPTSTTALSASTVANTDVELELEREVEREIERERTWVSSASDLIVNKNNEWRASDLIVNKNNKNNNNYDEDEKFSSLSTSTPLPSLSKSSLSESSSFSLSSLLSADILGPIFSIVVVVLFLLYTLLHDCGYGITDDYIFDNISQKVEILSKISWLPGRGSEAQSMVALVMAFSSFAQALTGFGFAVVAVGAMSSMPWLLHSELYDVITPVAATLGSLVGFILLIPYAFTSNDQKTIDNPGLEWKEIIPLLIPCTILTPLGMQLNSMIDPIIGTRILAALIMGFVGYKIVPMIQDSGGIMNNKKDNENETNDVSLSLSVVDTVDITVEQNSFLQSKTAAILFGCAAGIFGGAFDVQGPPLCIYGDAKGWSPAQFRNNILTVVALNSAFVVVIDSVQGGVLDNFYYSYFCLTSLPGVLAGVVIGQYASKRIDPILFKNLVLVMCLGLGIQLLTVS